MDCVRHSIRICETKLKVEREGKLNERKEKRTSDGKYISNSILYYCTSSTEAIKKRERRERERRREREMRERERERERRKMW